MRNKDTNLDSFIKHHKDAKIVDLVWLYDYNLIGENMTGLDYANAAEYLETKKILDKHYEGTANWIEEIFKKIKKSVEEVEF